MKKIIVFIFALMMIYSCGNKRGELIGVKEKKWFPEKPYGMTLVEGGAFIMGKQDDDIGQLKNAPAKTVTVRSFYMDETEITNSEYKQFVYWVRDSVTLAKLARKADETSTGEEGAAGEGIAEFAFKDADTADMTPFQKYMRENYYDLTEDPYEGRPLNWDQEVEYDPNSYVDADYV